MFFKLLISISNLSNKKFNLLFLIKKFKARSMPNVNAN